ncbi:sialate O-acetylesterase [Aporhodopirellula aestuarii]|uniref:Sialate O-acetylesterase n=1 Tax=Aporhodopirellula aestuarii TaxID=2950107 RepID=A0ABT0U0N4_9BACT|nr:sialate O-acetylesterase [Aporhodopirellula aestuarii]MCM2370316.1 sialate O-acetylesterase [Aporhodopirellula aestuarii]
MTVLTYRGLPCWFATLLLVISFAAMNCTAQEPRDSDNKPLKVFILAGQSNMQGHAHVRTIEAMRLNAKAAPLLDRMLNADGRYRTCEKTWISSIGSSNEEKTGRLTVGFGASANGPKIGPEFMFGLAMESMLDEPILIIKTAWGGKSLHTDFRPPSAGAYEFNDAQLATIKKQGKDIEQIKTEKASATGYYYRLMRDHVKSVLANISRVHPDYDAERGYELAGFVWFQGWNDMVDGGAYPDRNRPGGYDEYSHLLSQFIRDVRSDFDAPELPFVIGVMGVNGATSQYGPEQQRYKAVHQNFRDAMAAPVKTAKPAGSVVAVLTEEYWDAEAADLRRREKSIKPNVDKVKAAMKQNLIRRDEGEAKIEMIYAGAFDERELQILRTSTSNFEFHYMGSAGIMAQIGNGFAEAMARMIQQPVP